MMKPPALSLDACLDMVVLNKPFHISGHVFRDAPVLSVTLTGGGCARARRGRRRLLS